MNVIYLDIDGVMNSIIPPIEKYVIESDMHSNKLIMLKRVMDECNINGIVITSERRYDSVDIKNKIEVFKKYGMKVLGLTRKCNYDDLFDNRGKEIKSHYIRHKTSIDQFVILDDNDDGIKRIFPNNFIRISPSRGLEEKDIKKIKLKFELQKEKKKMKNENSNLLLEVMRTLKKGKRLTDSDLANVKLSLNKIDSTKKLYKVWRDENIGDFSSVINDINGRDFTLLYVDRNLKYVFVFCDQNLLSMPVMNWSYIEL